MEAQLLLVITKLSREMDEEDACDNYPHQFLIPRYFFLISLGQLIAVLGFQFTLHISHGVM